MKCHSATLPFSAPIVCPYCVTWKVTFVANHITAIRDGSTPDQWYHAEGAMNPGDHTSRGLAADAFLAAENGYWGRSSCGSVSLNGLN